MALCFRDREYCSAPCLTTDCDWNITPDVIHAAEEWGDGFGLNYAPIAQRDMSPHCSDFVSAVRRKDA